VQIPVSGLTNAMPSHFAEYCMPAEENAAVVVTRDPYDDVSRSLVLSVEAVRSRPVFTSVRTSVTLNGVVEACPGQRGGQEMGAEKAASSPRTSICSRSVELLSPRMILTTSESGTEPGFTIREELPHPPAGVELDEGQMEA
jgi:hypothetical protein